MTISDEDILSHCSQVNLVSPAGQFAYPFPYVNPYTNARTTAATAGEFLKAVAQNGVAGLTLYHSLDEARAREGRLRNDAAKRGVPLNTTFSIDPDDPRAEKETRSNEKLWHAGHRARVYDYLSLFPYEIICVYGLYQTRRVSTGEALSHSGERSFLVAHAGDAAGLALVESVFSAYPLMGRETVLFQPGEDLRSEVYNLDLKGGVLYYLEPGGGARIAAAEGITADFVAAWSGKTTIEGRKGIHFFDEPDTVTSYRVYSYGVSNDPSRLDAMEAARKNANLQRLVREKTGTSAAGIGWSPPPVQGAASPGGTNANTGQRRLLLLRLRVDSPVISWLVRRGRSGSEAGSWAKRRCPDANNGLKPAAISDMDILSWLAPANLISSTGRFAYPVFDPPRVREPVLACPADEYLKAVSEYGIVGVTVYHDFDTEGPLRERLERAARKKYGVPYDEASDVDPDDSWAREKAIKDEALRRQNRLETVYNYLAGFPQKIISVYGLYQTRREPAGEPLYRFEETSFLIPFGLVGGPKALAIARSVFDEFPQSVGRESVLFQPGKDMAADNLDLKGGVLYYLEPDGGVRIAAAEGITADFVETWSGKTTLEGPRGVRFYDEPGAVTSYRVYSYGISNEPGRFGAMTWGGKMAALQGLVEREKKKHDA